MFTLDIEQFTFELKNGAIKHVGPSNRAATAKLYDVDGVEIREFGDRRVKLGFEDEDGNEVEVALSPDSAQEVARGLETLADEGDVLD